MQKKDSELVDSVLAQNDLLEWVGLSHSALPWPMESSQARCEKPSALYEPGSLFRCTCEQTNLAFGTCSSGVFQEAKEDHRQGLGTYWPQLAVLEAVSNVIACRDLTNVKAHTSSEEEKLCA